MPASLSRYDRARGLALVVLNFRNHNFGHYTIGVGCPSCPSQLLQNRAS